jgi:8-oxo-dGTP pyrophosphatase MutT (NUDIX family)
MFDIDSIEAALIPFDWTFPRERRAEIDANWTRLSAEKPKTFNGRVLLQHESRIEGRVFHAGYFPTDYADFIAWIRFGPPLPTLRNGFAQAALQANDGGWLLGVMHGDSVNAGRIYFAAGTPDMSDVRPDGTLDLAASAARELEEEAGLEPGEVEIGEGWTVVLERKRAAFLRPCRIDLPADEARRLILSRVRAQAEPELADVHIVRGEADLRPDAMPDYILAFLRRALARDQR